MSGRLRVVRSRLAAVAHDTLAVPLAWYLAYWLRFNLERIPETYQIGRALCRERVFQRV